MEHKNLHEQMAGLLGGLSDEQKEKAKQCKTMDELMAFLNELGIALPDELLDTVAGGAAQRDRDLEFVLQLQKWDDVCQQRGIAWNDTSGREQVWKELYPNG